MTPNILWCWSLSYFSQFRWQFQKWIWIWAYQQWQTLPVKEYEIFKWIEMWDNIIQMILTSNLQWLLVNRNFNLATRLITRISPIISSSNLLLKQFVSKILELRKQLSIKRHLPTEIVKRKNWCYTENFQHHQSKWILSTSRF